MPTEDLNACWGSGTTGSVVRASAPWSAPDLDLVFNRDGAPRTHGSKDKEFRKDSESRTGDQAIACRARYVTPF